MNKATRGWVLGWAAFDGTGHVWVECSQGKRASKPKRSHANRRAAEKQRADLLQLRYALGGAH